MHSESPSKRRKKNDSKSVPVPNRSLDFFFRKQNNQQDATEASSKPAVIHNTNGDSPVPETQLTDEELARKLQEEWAKEDGKDFVSAALEASPAEPQSAPNDTKKGVLGLQSTVSEEDTITLTLPF